MMGVLRPSPPRARPVPNLKHHLHTIKDGFSFFVPCSCPFEVQWFLSCLQSFLSLFMWSEAFHFRQCYEARWATEFCSCMSHPISLVVTSTHDILGQSSWAFLRLLLYEETSKHVWKILSMNKLGMDLQMFCTEINLSFEPISTHFLKNIGIFKNGYLVHFPLIFV